jgi:lysophospholipase L1-like esterase
MTRHLLGSIGLAVLLVGCVEDQAVNPPTATEGDLFASYVAIGNSITAGFQSGGIDSTTQSQSYAVLLAGQMGTEFFVPWLNPPGCPAPYTNIFTQMRVGGTGGSDCGFRTAGSTGEFHTNLAAVPGASVIDVLTSFDPASDPNPLTTFLLGGRSQVAVAREARPTFVTVWIGNNDVLGAILSPTNPGDPALVTPVATFAQRYTDLLDSLDAIGTVEGGVLIGVVQTALAPYLSQGRAWAQFEADFDVLTTPLNALDVVNCLAFQPLGGGDTAWVSVPFPVGGAALASAQAKLDSVDDGLLAAGSMTPAVIDCDSPAAVSVAEMVNLLTAVTGYNAAIENEALDRGLVYLDPNVLLQQQLAEPGAILPFPTFTDQTSPAPFGTSISMDGIHPSASAHRLITDALIAAINAAYGTTIPEL